MRRNWNGVSAIGLSALVLAPLAPPVGGCATDTVELAGSKCGNGIREPEEECDVESPGCKKCKEVSGWACRDNVCTEVCGDGKVVGSETCDPPDKAKCDTSCHLAAFKPEACDMSGVWIVRQTDFSEANVGTKGIQTSSNWYYLEIVQSGDSWTVKKSLFCGIVVTGSVSVRLQDAATRALMYRNPQADGRPGGARTGVMMAQGDGCYFKAARHYFIRGGKDSLLPSNFDAEPALETLPALPKSNDLYDASKGGDLAQAEDTDADGFVGVAYDVSGLIAGTRNVVQRDWCAYESDDAHKVPKNASEFIARSDFRNQEQILHVKCSASKCPLLEAGSSPSLDHPGRVVFRYLGKTATDETAKAIVVAPPGADPDKDFQTCMNIQAAIPHDKASQ